MKSMKISIMNALIWACLFGINAPLAKVFLAEIEPVLMASFLYLGSGLGLFMVIPQKNCPQRVFYDKIFL